MSISTKFENFCKNIRISDSDNQKIISRYHQITKRINLDYYNSDSDTNHSLYIGSYGRDTEIFTSDIDMLVQLPYEVYQKYNNYTGNGQSALLQDVKDTISKTYSTTHLKGDGQIVSINWVDNINFEILPTFINKDGSYTYPDSNGGGRWRTADPKSEIKAIKETNDNCNNNLKNLCRMCRAWKNTNNVDIKGITIDVLAYKFLSTYCYKDKSYLYYDYMTRDFFKYLSEIDINQISWKVMGSNRYITDTGYFQYKAKQAYNTSLEAIKYENENKDYSANIKWRNIYGTKF